MKTTQTKVKLIEIEWLGPFKTKELSSKEFTNDDAYGVYQIYGTHEIFGPHSLLYLGKADLRGFEKRLKEHHPWLKWEPSDIDIHIGKLGGIGQMSEDEWSNQIDQAERLLVHYCSPPYNSSLIANYRASEDIIVNNFGKKQRIPSSLSSLHFSSPFWNDDEKWQRYRFK